MQETLKMVIVDDDAVICNFLEKNIDYNNIGLELLGIASDEQHLFKLISPHFPNIIITSIQFFKLCGLKLFKQANALNVECKFIVIFDEDSLHLKDISGISFRVDYFLQKPLESQEVNEILMTLKSSVLSVRDANGRRSVPIVEPQFFKYYRSLQRLYLLRVLHGEEVPSDPMTVENEYAIDFKNEYFQCCAFKFDIPNNIPELDFNGFSPLLSKIFRFIKKRLSGDANLISCTENNYFYIVANFDNQHSQSVSEKFKEVFEVAKNTVCLYKGSGVTLGISRLYKNLDHLQEALYETQYATYFRLNKGLNRIIYFSDILSVPHRYSDEQKNLLFKNLEQIFIKFDIEGYKDNISEIFKGNLGNAAEIVELSLMMAKILFAPSVLPRTIDKEEAAFQQHKLHTGIENAISITQLKEHVLKSIEQILRYRSNISSGHSAKPIRDALNYIKDHYREPLSLDCMSNQVALTPVYFSNLFKKETGETFINYLNKYRIEKAKECLIKTSDNVSEIAYIVGFNDPKYFSRLFRKYVGLTPLAYRSIYG